MNRSTFGVRECRLLLWLVDGDELDRANGGEKVEGAAALCLLRHLKSAGLPITDLPNRSRVVASSVYFSMAFVAALLPTKGEPQSSAKSMPKTSWISVTEGMPHRFYYCIVQESDLSLKKVWRGQSRRGSAR